MASAPRGEDGLSRRLHGILYIGVRLAHRSRRPCALFPSLGACCLADVDHKRHHAVCLLAACIGIAAANPLSIASRNDTTYDPDHPGIVGCTRHPVLWAAMLWASAHVPPNGDLAHVIVFCMFAALGIFGALIIDVRKQQIFGTTEWLRLSAHTSFVPLVALFTGRWLPSPYNPDLFRLLAATVLYFSFLMLHDIVIGVSPLPPL